MWDVCKGGVICGEIAISRKGERSYAVRSLIFPFLKLQDFSKSPSLASFHVFGGHMLPPVAISSNFEEMCQSFHPNLGGEEILWSKMVKSSLAPALDEKVTASGGRAL